MENNKNEKIKPFSMVITDDDIRAVEGEEAVKERHEKLQKPFIMDETMMKEKEYLVLMEFEFPEEDRENERFFDFITGTTATVYDYIKDIMYNDNEAGLDIMHSYVLVDSPKVSISKRITIYKFMKNAIVTGKVIDESGFNIDEFYYEDPDEEEEE